MNWKETKQMMRYAARKGFSQKMTIKSLVEKWNKHKEEVKELMEENIVEKIKKEGLTDENWDMIEIRRWAVLEDTETKKAEKLMTDSGLIDIK